jgi:hypothetical protein
MYAWWHVDPLLGESACLELLQLNCSGKIGEIEMFLEGKDGDFDRFLQT